MKFKITLICCTLLSVVSNAQNFGLIKKYWEPDGIVNTVVRDSINNRLYVGGSFDHVATEERFGSQMDTLGNFDFGFDNPIDGGVEVSIPDGNGGWYIGGRFTQVGDSTRTRIAHLDSNGKVTNKFKNLRFSDEVKTMLLKNDTLFVGGSFRLAGEFRQYSTVRDINSGAMSMDIPEADGLVTTSVPDGNGGVFIGGLFENIGGVARGGLAHIDQFGNLTSWNPAGTGSSSIATIKLSGDTLFVGGSFYSLGGAVNQNIAAIDKNTGAIFSWSPMVNSSITSLEVTDDEVIFGGQFTQVNGQVRNKLAVCNKNTGVLKAWNPNFNNNVYAIKVVSNDLYIGGRFTTVGNQIRNKVASFNLTTKSLNSWNPNISATPSYTTVSCIEKYGANIILGGTFDSIGGQQIERVAAVNVTTGALINWNPNLQGSVESLKVIDDELFVVGGFQSVSGVNQSCMAKFDSNLVQLPWEIYCNNQVYTTCEFGQNLFVGGSFDAFQSEPSGYLAAIDLVGDSILDWNTFITSTGAHVNAIELNNNKLYVGGEFTMMGTSVRHGLGSIDLNTDLLTTWDPNLNIYSKVNDLHVAGNHLYVGGDFNLINGQFQSGLAQYDLNSHTLNSWNPNIGGTEIYAIDTDGSNVYFGGDFSSVGGQQRLSFAQVDQITGNLGSLNPKPASRVLSVKVNGNKVMLGGEFLGVYDSNLDYFQRNRIAEIEISTGDVTALDPNVGGNNRYVKHLAMQGNKVYISGSYLRIGRLIRKNFVAYNYTTGEVLTWAPNIDGDVNDMVLQDSLLYIGGGFNLIDNKQRGLLGAVNVYTQNVDSLNNLSSVVNFGNSVRKIAIKDSTLFVGGAFNSLNGQSRLNLGSYNTNSGLLNSFNPSPNARVNDILPLNGSLFIGGAFSFIQGQNRVGVAELNASTGTISTWQTVATGEVKTLHLNGNELIVGGEFTQMGGQSRINLASINVQNGMANVWNPALTGTGFVQTITQLNNEYWVGKVTTGWSYPSGFQKVHPSTGIVSNWDNEVEADEINSITAFNDSVIIGGDLTHFNIQRYLVLMKPCSPLFFVDTVVACNSYTWIDGVTYYMSDTSATKTFVTANGCDSVVTLNLSLTSSQIVTPVIVQACDSFTWNGITYTTSTNLPTDTLVNMAGCDSIVNLNLTIVHPTFGTDVINACDSFTWINGVTYLSSNNTAQDTLVNAMGCDSVVTLDLTISTIDSAVSTFGDTLIAQEIGVSYQWFDCLSNSIVPGETNSQFIPAVSGSYQVILSNGNCVDTSSCFQIIKCQNQANFTWVDNGSGNFSFNNTSLGNQTQYHWAFGDGSTATASSITHPYLTDGNYVVVLTTNDSNASTTCLSYHIDSISVTGVGSSLPCMAGFSVYYDSANTSVNVVNNSIGTNLSYTWDFGDGSSSNLQYPTHNYTSNGPFNFCLTVDNGIGCVDTYCDSIINTGVWFRSSGFELVVEGQGINGISQIGVSENVRIYPNPVQDHVNIEISNWHSKTSKLKVLDVTGKLVYTQEIEFVSSQETFQINTSQWAKGTYFIEIGEGVHKVVEQMVVQ